MLSPAKPTTRFLGCDVGKTEIVVHEFATPRSRSIANEAKALAKFAAELDTNCFVVCEATGGYEAGLLAALFEAGVPAHRADARKVKAFIRSFGTLGKTDKLDAKALARYANDRHATLAPWRAGDVERSRLQALVLLRRDLVKDRQAYVNRRKAPTAEPLHAHLDRLIEDFERQIEAVEADIEALLGQCEPIRKARDTLVEIPGIGHTTAVALLAMLPELGASSAKKIAALAGLAPHPNQSGAEDAYRRARGGRPEVKCVIFMAALSASKHHPILRAFHDRLVQAGKKPLVAIIAVMRKLVTFANAKLKALAFARANPVHARNADQTA
jgi:transposase